MKAFKLFMINATGILLFLAIIYTLTELSYRLPWQVEPVKERAKP